VRKRGPFHVVPGNGTGDARKASVGFAVPEKAIISDRDVVGCSLPLTHQDGAGSRQWLGCKLGPIVAVTERTGKQPVEFLGDRRKLFYTEAGLSSY
jgi:hypothetical protein